MKNSTTASNPRAIPTRTGRWRCRTKRSSRQPTIRGTGSQHPEVGMGEGQADQDERGEAEEESTDEGGRGPGHPPPEQPEHGQGGQGWGDQIDEVQRRHRSEQPGDRGRDHPQPERVRRHVDAPRDEELGGVEGVEAVAQGVGRPLDDPQGQGGVAAPAGGHRPRMGQHVPPQDQRQGQVGAAGQQVGAPPPVPAAGVVGSRVDRLPVAGTGRIGRVPRCRGAGDGGPPRSPVPRGSTAVSSAGADGSTVLDDRWRRPSGQAPRAYPRPRGCPGVDG